MHGGGRGEKGYPPHSCGSRRVLVNRSTFELIKTAVLKKAMFWVRLRSVDYGAEADLVADTYVPSDIYYGIDIVFDLNEADLAC
jgi:hypothetical protein